MNGTQKAASDAYDLRKLNEHEKAIMLQSWSVDFCEVCDILLKTHVVFIERHAECKQLLQLNALVTLKPTDWYSDDAFRNRTLAIAQFLERCLQVWISADTNIAQEWKVDFEKQAIRLGTEHRRHSNFVTYSLVAPKWKPEKVFQDPRFFLCRLCSTTHRKLSRVASDGTSMKAEHFGWMLDILLEVFDNSLAFKKLSAEDQKLAHKLWLDAFAYIKRLFTQGWQNGMSDGDNLTELSDV